MDEPTVTEPTAARPERVPKVSAALAREAPPVAHETNPQLHILFTRRRKEPFGGKVALPSLHSVLQYTLAPSSYEFRLIPNISLTSGGAIVVVSDNPLSSYSDFASRKSLKTVETTNVSPQPPYDALLPKKTNRVWERQPL